MVNIWKINLRGMRIRTVSENVLDEHNGRDDDTLLGFYSAHAYNNSNFMIKSVFKRKILSTIIIVKESDFPDFLSKIETSVPLAHFYTLVVGISGSYNWKRLILFDSQLIESELSFSQDGIIQENFNLQGNQIIPSGLTWNPYHQ